MPRKKAIADIISVVGNKKITELNREDALKFRDWWMNKVKTENLSANYANKQIGYLSIMLSTVGDHYRLNLDKVFAGLRFGERQKRQRLPFSSQYITDVLLDDDKLSGLNAEAISVLRVLINTGARISEVCGLEPEDIKLEASVPHIIIRENQIRELKTTSSRRELPLLKSSLVAMQQWRGGFERYCGKNELASTTINKYLRENQLLPTSDSHTIYSVYSLRHGFQQRLIDIEAPERLQAELMGHAINRPRYGKGPDLEQKAKWLNQIAL